MVQLRKVNEKKRQQQKLTDIPSHDEASASMGSESRDGKKVTLVENLPFRSAKLGLFVDEEPLLPLMPPPSTVRCFFEVLETSLLWSALLSKDDDEEPALISLASASLCTGCESSSLLMAVVTVVLSQLADLLESVIGATPIAPLDDWAN